MALNIGDATLSFLGDTTQLDQVFARVPEQAAASMGAAAASVGQVGTAAQGVNFELDATAENAAYAGGAIDEGFKKGAMSTREAHGALMLVENMFGVHLPRAMTTLLAHIPIINAAFSTMLPLIGAVAAVAIILKLIEHHEALAAAQAKAALAVENLRIKEDDHTKSMELSNLKLDDQIAKLENRPDRNKLKEAMLETSLASDALATAFSKDFEKIDEVINSTTGLVGWLKQNMFSLGMVLAAGPGDLGAAFDRLFNGTKNTAAAMELVREQLVLINKLRVEQEKATGEDQQVAAAKALGVAYNGLAQLQQHSFDVVQKEAPKNLDAMQKLTEGILSATAAEKDQALQVENIQKHAKVAREEEAEAIKQAAEKAATAADKAFEKQAKAVKQEADWEEHAWKVAYDRAVADLQETEKLKIEATQKGSQARLAAIDAAIKEEQSKGLQETGFYKSLESQKTQIITTALADRLKIENQTAAEKLKATETAEKVGTAKITEQYSEQEKAVEQLVKFKLLSETQGAHQLELLYSQENAKILSLLNNLLKAEQDAVKAAQAKLKTEESNPFISPQQIAELHKLLGQAEQAVATTEIKIASTTKTFQEKQLTLDRAYYGEALALAVASGDKLLTQRLQDTHAALLSAEAQKVDAKARGLNTDAINLEIKALQREEIELAKEATQRQKTEKVFDVAFADFKKKSQEMANINRTFGNVFATTAAQMQAGLASAVASAILGSESFSVAMQKMLATALATMAGEAAVDALYYTAKGFVALATRDPRAGEWFMAAGIMAGIAGGAAAAGRALNPGSGTGAGSTGPAMTTGNAATQPGSGGGQGVNVPHLAGGGLITGPTLAMLGESSGREAVIPLNDGNAMNMIAEAISKHLKTGGGGTNFYIKGMVSSDQVGKLAKKLTRQVQTGRTRLTASNTHKITRRA